MENRFAFVNNELVYVLSGTFASDSFIKNGNFNDVTGRSFSYLHPNTGRGISCDHSMVQLDAPLTDIKISVITKKCQELVKADYEIFGDYLTFSHYCKLHEKLGNKGKGKFATFSALKMWKENKTYKVIYLHDSIQGDVNIYQEEIEKEEIPSHAFKDVTGELYYAFL